VERKTTAPPLSSECEQVDGCRGLKHRKRLPRVSEDRRTPFRDGLKTCCSETSTGQHILYNKQGLFGVRPSCDNLSARRTLELLFPSPAPPRKTSTAYPKTPPNPRAADPCHKDSHPKPASDCVLTPSRARISSPLVTAREQRPHRAPNRNVCNIIRDALRNPLTDPSPGANPPIYPSSLPLASGNLFSNIFPKIHGFFSFPQTYISFVLSSRGIVV
jgi:hypothetical protein